MTRLLWRKTVQRGHAYHVARGKVAMSLDLDRHLFPFATASQIEDHIGHAHEALSLPEGGLMLQAEVSLDFSLGTMDTIFTALEQVCRLPAPADCSP